MFDDVYLTWVSDPAWGDHNPYSAVGGSGRVWHQHINALGSNLTCHLNLAAVPRILFPNLCQVKKKQSKCFVFYVLISKRFCVECTDHAQ